jgi:pyrimidine operon attenuation protein/uracil phosphoribosyltransferase
MIITSLKKISKQKIHLESIKLSAANPLSREIIYSGNIEILTNKVVIIVDDVANSGRTVFYAFKPFYEILAKKIEVAVLVDRTHKLFPVKADYVGLSLATTMKDNISVKIREVEEYEVFLD